MKQHNSRENFFEKKHNRSNSKFGNRRQSNGENKNGNGSGNNGNNGNGSLNSINHLNDEELQSHFNDRLSFLIFNSIGSNVKVLTNSGSTIQGILENIDPKTLKLIIKENNQNGKKSFTTFNYEDLLDFEIEDVDLFNTNYQTSKTSFKTDQDIGGSNGAGIQSNGQRSEMEKWVPETSELSGTLESLSLEDDDTKKWDQFQTNEEKFGIKSEFDEHLYTTKINKNDPNYLKKLEKAEKIAKEIESQGFNGNVHLAEERGLKFDDSGIDEEDKYSGVDRSVPASIQIDAKGDALFQSLINKDSKDFQFGGATGGSKYVPPSQRSKIQNIDPSIISADNKNKISDSKPPVIPTARQVPSIPPKPQVQPQVNQKENYNEQKARVPVVQQQQQQQQQPPLNKRTTVENLKKINTLNEINSLKEFSQTFKIPTKFSNNKTKQDDLKNLETSDKSPKEKEVPSEKPVEKPIEPTPVDKSKSSTPRIGNKRLGDPAKVATFKLNPKAASFTPSATATPSSATSNVSTPVFNKNSPKLANYQTKRRHQGFFFSQDKLASIEKRQQRDFDNEFNFFKGCLDDFNKKKREQEQKQQADAKPLNFFLEKPFQTPPTWTRDEGIEKPYKSFFTDLENSRNQRFIPPTPLNAPIQPFQTIPMMQQPTPQLFYPPQPFIPNQYLQLSPQQQASNLTQSPPSHSPYQQHQRPMFQQHPQGAYNPAVAQAQAQAQAQAAAIQAQQAGYQYQTNRYNGPPPPSGGYYPPPNLNSNGYPTPVIPFNQINSPLPPPAPQSQTNSNSRGGYNKNR